MTPEQVAAFWRYGYCPRGSGDRDDHRRKFLVHAIVAGYRVCIDEEALPR